MAYRLGTLSGEIDPQTFRRADFARYWDHIATMDPDRFLALLDAAGTHSAADLLPSVKAPTLVVAADGDTFTPPALAASTDFVLLGIAVFAVSTSAPLIRYASAPALAIAMWRTVLAVPVVGLLAVRHASGHESRIEERHAGPDPGRRRGQLRDD